MWKKRDANDNNVGWMSWGWHEIAGCETYPNGFLSKLAINGNWYDLKDVTGYGIIILNIPNCLKAKAQKCSLFK